MAKTAEQQAVRTFDPDFIEAIERGSLFTTRANTSFRMGLPQDRGGYAKWFRTQLSEQVLIAGTNKRRQAKLATRPPGAREFQLIIDPDSLAASYRTYAEQAEALANGFPPGSAFLFETLSQKTKVSVLVKSEGDCRDISLDELRAAIRSRVPADVLPHVDLCSAALEVLFLPPKLSLLAKYAAWLRWATPVRWEDIRGPNANAAPSPRASISLAKPASPAEQRGGEVCPGSAPALALLPKFNGVLSESFARALEDMALARPRLNPAARDCAARILVAQWSLATEEGFAIPVRLLARSMAAELGRGFSPETARNYLRAFIETGHLQETGRVFHPPVKAWSSSPYYRAAGPLLEAVLTHSPPPDRPALPALIADGRWETTLFAGAHHHYPRLEAFLDWVLGQPGLWAMKRRSEEAVEDTSDRPHKAARAWTRVAQSKEGWPEEFRRHREAELLKIIREKGNLPG